MTADAHVRLWVALTPDGDRVDVEALANRNKVQSTDTRLKGRPVAVVDLFMRDGRWSVQLVGDT